MAGAVPEMGGVNVEIRCQAPRKRLRFDGDTCGGYVGTVPAVLRPRVVGLVAHSDLSHPDHATIPCQRCGFLHEIALDALQMRPTLAVVRLAA
jgi:hypothetical protein